ncbi:hypothetical protein [Plantactinospora sp. B5E13]|uniref:hypothetical protein n=1 Tax=Plantactinospora sp. B5E13 TaxID=3153758 RepID=UPI00325DC865
MRHLGSLLLGLISVPLIWMLSAFGSWKLNGGLLEESAGDRFLGFLCLLGVGIILAAMLVPRISPIGPIIAGGFYLLVSFWALVHIESLAKVIPDDLVGPAGLMNVPVGTISMLVAIPLLATAVSPDRWRGRARSAPAAGYPGVPGQPGQPTFPPGPAGQQPPAGQFPPGGQPPAGQYPPGAPAGYPPNFGPSAPPSHSPAAPPNFPANYGPAAPNPPAATPYHGQAGPPAPGSVPGQPVSGAPGSAPPVPTPMPPSFAPPGPRPPTSAPPVSSPGFAPPAPPRSPADETTQFGGRSDDDGTEGPTRKLGDTRPF